MAESSEAEAQEHEFQEVDNHVDLSTAYHLELDDLRNVDLHVTADLGHSGMLVRDILELKQGSIVPLSKMAGEMTDIYVNGRPLAKGEVVVIGDTLHVRLAEIVGMNELLED